MDILNVLTVIGKLVPILGTCSVCVLGMITVANGVKCLLRSEMLRIYYRHQESGEIRQYEYENFMYLYAAYKKLHGNSFIDKICEEVKKFKVRT